MKALLLVALIALFAQAYAYDLCATCQNGCSKITNPLGQEYCSNACNKYYCNKADEEEADQIDYCGTCRNGCSKITNAVGQDYCNQACNKYYCNKVDSEMADAALGWFAPIKKPVRRFEAAADQVDLCGTCRNGCSKITNPVGQEYCNKACNQYYCNKVDEEEADQVLSQSNFCRQFPDSRGCRRDDDEEADQIDYCGTCRNGCSKITNPLGQEYCNKACDQYYCKKADESEADILYNRFVMRPPVRRPFDEEADQVDLCGTCRNGCSKITNPVGQEYCNKACNQYYCNKADRVFADAALGWFAPIKKPVRRFEAAADQVDLCGTCRNGCSKITNPVGQEYCNKACNQYYCK